MKTKKECDKKSLALVRKSLLTLKNVSKHNNKYLKISVFLDWICVNTTNYATTCPLIKYISFYQMKLPVMNNLYFIFYRSIKIDLFLSGKMLQN